MTVVFLTGVPFIKQHENDMYVTAISNVFEVEKWDCSYLFGRGSDAVSDIIPDRLLITSSEQFYNELERIVESSEQKGVCIITNILITKLKKLYPEIKKYGIPIYNIDKESLANWLTYRGLANDTHPDSLVNKLSAVVMNSPFLRNIYKFVRRGNVRYDVVFSGFNYYPEDNIKFVKTHNIKYDEYMRAKQSLNIIGCDYILFIDAALANHPMFANSSRKPLDTDKYLFCLNAFFDKIEKKYKKKVVISAHPKSDYKASDFKYRAIYKYKTPELLQHCSYVVSHYSTSLIDAILLYKPIIVLFSEDLITSSTRKSVLMGTEFAKMLCLPLIDLDSECEPVFNFSKERYDKFISEHVVNQNKAELCNSDIVIDYILNLKGQDKRINFHESL